MGRLAQWPARWSAPWLPAGSPIDQMTEKANLVIPVWPLLLLRRPFWTPSLLTPPFYNPSLL